MRSPSRSGTSQAVASQQSGTLAGYTLPAPDVVDRAASQASVSSNATCQGQAASEHAGARRAVPGFLLSLALHLLLLIALALLTYSDELAVGVSTLTMNSAQPAESLSELAEFQIEAPQQEQEAEAELPDASEAADLLNRELPELPAVETPVIENAGQVVSTSTSSNSEQLEDVAGDALGEIAASIQSRVAQAGGKEGEVQFALAWRDRNDVDLHVIAPSGERISHMHRRSRCRGALDVDMNVTGESRKPVENVRWIQRAPWGRYTVLVNLYKINESSRRGRRSSFDLLAKLGDTRLINEGQVSPGDQVSIVRFVYIPKQLPAGMTRARVEQDIASLQLREEAAAQPMLNQALEIEAGRLRDGKLQQLIATYPHTDAAIQAMRELGGVIRKPR